MLILKTSKQFCPADRIVRCDEYMLHAKAEEILEIAQKKKQKLLEHADVQIKLMKENAQSECDELFKNAQAESEKQCQQKMLEMIFSMTENGIRYFSLLEQTFVQALKDLFLKILGEIPPEERIYQLVKQSIKTLSEEKTLHISVHPDQLVLLKSKTDELIAQHPSLKHIEVVADKELPIDSCLLETETGILDASIPLQLGTLIKAVQASLK